MPNFTLRAPRRRAALVRAGAWALLAGAPLLLSACLSVPVSTVWKLYNFGPDEFFALDPTQLRAAVRTDTRASFESVDVRIDIQIKGAPVEHHEFALRQAQALDPRLEAAPPGMRWFVFSLGPEGERLFARLRERVKTIPRGQGNSATLGFGAREGKVPPDLATKLPVRIDMLMDNKEGWFTLMKETRIDTTRAPDAR